MYQEVPHDILFATSLEAALVQGAGDQVYLVFRGFV